MKRLFGWIAFYALVAAIILYSVFPFYYAIVTSLKAGSQLFSVEYFPTTWNWDNYVSVFREQPFAYNLLNSVLVSSAVVALSLFTPAATAFGLIALPAPMYLIALGLSFVPVVVLELCKALGLFEKDK